MATSVSTTTSGGRELRVWVDDQERIVCGLSESTTCQEVIYALANATARTGRFVLVEKWRNTERTLAPHDCPLKLLDNWREHATNVRFVLRHLDAGGMNSLVAPPQVQQQTTNTAGGYSYASLPREKYNQLQQRSNSVMGNAMYGWVVIAKAKSDVLVVLKHF